MVNPVPEGTHTVTPHLVIKGAAKAIDFYARAFGAQEHHRMAMPGGLIGHAELQIGDSLVYLADASPQGAARSPQTLKGSSVVIHLYVDDVDSMFRRAVGAGAKVLMPVTDMFWGDRFGQVQDPFGHVWSVATHKEDVSPDEMARRMAAMPPPSPARKKSARAPGKAKASAQPGRSRPASKVRGKARRK